MSPIEDEIRGALRAEAARLQEMRPLRLPAVASYEPQAGPRARRARRARRLRVWAGPTVAAAVVLLIAVAQVTLKSAWDGHSVAPAASPSPIAGPALPGDAVPRYYVYLGSGGRSVGPAIVVGDEKAGKTIATVPLLPKGQSDGDFTGTDETVTGAADDRTFIVSGSYSTLSSVHAGTLDTTLTWYLVQIRPSSTDPVRVTKLPIQFPASVPTSGGGLDVLSTALSGDGTELAVLSARTGAPWASGEPLTLQVYSVATGRLQHSWSAGIKESKANPNPVSDLSWVGDGTLGFAVTYIPAVREEVRTLDVSASGGGLLADSHVVWSQDVPATTPLTPREEASISTIEPPPHACDTPFLTGNGQVVVCGDSSYSASTKRLTALWLAYPLGTPARPRVLGRVEEPQNVTHLNGWSSVEWTNPSGTEVIGTWNLEVITGPSNNPVSSVTNNEGYIGKGRIKTFPFNVGGLDVTW
jgi:hypothetical protein